MASMVTCDFDVHPHEAGVEWPCRNAVPHIDASVEDRASRPITTNGKPAGPTSTPHDDGSSVQP